MIRKCVLAEYYYCYTEELQSVLKSSNVNKLSTYRFTTQKWWVVSERSSSNLIYSQLVASEKELTWMNSELLPVIGGSDWFSLIA